MGKLIDIDEASGIVRLECGQWVWLANTIIKEFYALKSVDAVHVVRCKDCKFFYQMTAETGICELGCPHFGNDGFCSEGERKDGEHDRG